MTVPVPVPAGPKAITAAPAPPAVPAPPSGAPVVAAEGGARGTATPPTPQLRGAQTGRLKRPAPPPPPGEVLTWIGAACALAGQPHTVTVSAATTDCHVHVPDADTFRAWCTHLSIPPAAVRRESSALGCLAEATTVRNGWALHVRLFGPQAEDLP